MRQLDQNLLKTELLAKRLDYQMTKKLTYGWSSDEDKNWNSDVQDTFDMLDLTVSQFVSELENRSNDQSSSDLIQTLSPLFRYLMESVSSGDSVVRTAGLEILKSILSTHRSLVRERLANYKTN